MRHARRVRTGPAPSAISGTRAAASKNAILYQRPALPQQLAVVAREEHDRVVLEPGLAQRAEHLADAVVDVADRRVVGVAGAPDLGVVERGGVDARHVAQPQAVRIGLRARDRPDRRQVDRVRVVAVPVLAAQLPRVVRMRERDGQEERAVVAARVVEQRAHGPRGDLVVVVHLHRRRADAGVSTLSIEWYQGRRSVERDAPVRRPAEVRGVDVAGQPVLVAVQLVGPDEVHLAGQRGGVARGAQVVRDGRLGRRAAPPRCRTRRCATAAGR